VGHGEPEEQRAASEAAARSVQRQVESILGEHHLGQQVGAGAAAGDRVKRRRRFADL
jgi:hypothetical protein